MTALRFEASQVRDLAADLGIVAAEAIPASRAVTQKGALNIKQGWQRRWSGLSHAPMLAAAVTYDTKMSGMGAMAEIGPDKGRPQGALGNLLEFGSVNNGPIPGGAPSLDEEAPRFEKALSELAEKALGL